MEEMKKCPYCGKEVLAVAKKCRHCGQWIVKKEQVPTHSPIAPASKRNGKMSVKKWLLYILLSIVGGVVLIVARILKTVISIDDASPTKSETVFVCNDTDDSESGSVDIYDMKKKQGKDSPSEQQGEVDNVGEEVLLEDITTDDPEELISIAESYENSVETDVNLRKAFYYYKLAAEIGNPAALNKVGNMYAIGRGCKKDPTLAAKYYYAASVNGNKYAQHNLGFCYWDGNGVEKNRDEALVWLRRSAAQGYEPAIRFLNNLGEE